MRQFELYVPNCAYIIHELFVPIYRKSYYNIVSNLSQYNYNLCQNSTICANVATICANVAHEWICDVTTCRLRWDFGLGPGISADVSLFDPVQGYKETFCPDSYSTLITLINTQTSTQR